MSRVLLADDSAHAQRMGVRILREEGLEVVSVTDGDAAVARLTDTDPDLLVADVFLPGKSGLDLCRYVRESPNHAHTRVVLTAGILEPIDENAAKQAGCDAILRKPFEASTMIRTLKPLLEAAEAGRNGSPLPVLPPEPTEPVAASAKRRPKSTESPESGATGVAEPNRELVRAAVTVALDAAFPALVDELTERVLAALRR